MASALDSPISDGIVRTGGDITDLPKRSRQVARRGSYIRYLCFGSPLYRKNGFVAPPDSWRIYYMFGNAFTIVSGMGD